MVGLRNISAEFKSAAVFGTAALFLSLLTGFAAGIEVSIVFLRSLVLSLVFTALGYGVVFIIKKFVPEVYQAIKNLSGGEQVDVDIDDENEGDNVSAGASEQVDAGADSKAAVDMPEPPIAEDISGGGKAKKDEFSELGEDYYDKMESAPSANAGGDEFGTELPEQSGQSQKTGGSKTKSLGKHIIVQDDLVRYEPKLMAEAVRTMIRKDD